MSLHEQYAELVRRGMPKPDEPGITDFGEWCYRCMMDGEVALMTESDARDLITMHALRWWSSDERCRRVPGPRAKTLRNADWCDLLLVSVDKDSAWVQCGTWGYDGIDTPARYQRAFDDCDTILAAILAATEHLKESP